VKNVSRQTPDAALLSRRSEAKTDDVQQQTHVAQDLELLANFIPNVAIAGMEPFQFALKSINIGG